jgi:hypothetical protein
VTPLAMAKAIASGSATTPTMTPAVRSARHWAFVYPRIVVNSFGTSTSGIEARRPVSSGGSLDLSRGDVLRPKVAA